MINKRGIVLVQLLPEVQPTGQICGTVKAIDPSENRSPGLNFEYSYLFHQIWQLPP
jgi:hypothetical protein